MVLSDIEIANSVQMKPIKEVAEKLGIAEDALSLYGNYKAKISAGQLEALKDRPDGKLILVTAISPTPAGEGKTTTSVGLVDALATIGKKAVIALREPSLGPVFGIKGGAAGGGHAQVVPWKTSTSTSLVTFMPSVLPTTCWQPSLTTTSTMAMP